MYSITPLRYPGGKGRLANFVKLVFQKNHLLDGNYVEPYAGGAAVALSLLFDEYVTHVHINDLNKSVYAFWHVVLNDTDGLCARIRDTPVTIREWHKQRAVQADSQNYSLLDLGFSTFFMNRTNRSGIITGGIIGGQDQSGFWKLDARYNKSNLIERIERIARYRSRISVYNEDAEAFLQTVPSILPGATLVYLDPPYYKKGQDLYENYYEHADHAKISDLLSNLDKYWIVSYDKVPEVLKLYRKFRHLFYNLSYSASARYQGTEVLFFCPKLRIPFAQAPATLGKRLRR